MASLRELRQKVKSVKSTQQITKAMKMVSAARLSRAQERILSARPFVDKLELLLQEISYLIQENKETALELHPLLQQRDSRRLDVVLVTSDRGLCGGFNANLIRKATQYLREHQDLNLRLWLVGKKGRDFFRRFSKNIEKEYVGIFQQLQYTQAEIIGSELIDTFLNTDTRGIVFIYNEFKSRLQQQLVVKPLLPMSALPAAKPHQDFIYEPNRQEILEELLPRYLKAQIFRILLESQAAELAARMTAMENATNNARDLISSLTLTMNKVRQAGITKELAEIVSGAEALQN
ncbi:MAG: ATP synthase gamma chain [Elusimicrobia bacterium]|nr:ATP synthase gamma chain [Elusimicrobiota bacterium]